MPKFFLCFESTLLVSCVFNRAYSPSADAEV